MTRASRPVVETSERVRDVVGPALCNSDVSHAATGSSPTKWGERIID